MKTQQIKYFNEVQGRGQFQDSAATTDETFHPTKRERAI